MSVEASVCERHNVVFIGWCHACASDERAAKELAEFGPLPTVHPCNERCDDDGHFLSSAPVASDDEREALAELLSWATGEMTRYSETAHEDHNRWSWRGDGHGEHVRTTFLAAAQVVLDEGWSRSAATSQEVGK